VIQLVNRPRELLTLCIESAQQLCRRSPVQQSDLVSPEGER
jgi:hypothetical protein